MPEAGRYVARRLDDRKERRDTTWAGRVATRHYDPVVLVRASWPATARCG